MLIKHTQNFEILFTKNLPLFISLVYTVLLQDMCVDVTVTYINTTTLVPSDPGHAVHQEAAPVKQPHPAPDLLPGGYRRQWAGEHRHPQQ